MIQYAIPDYAALLRGKKLCLVGPDGQVKNAVRELFTRLGAEEISAPADADLLVCGFLPYEGLTAEEAMEAGFLSQLTAIRAAAAGMRARLGGTVTAVIPGGAAHPGVSTAACGASGAALESFLRGLSMECARFRVRCNTVRCGRQIYREASGAEETAVLLHGQPLAIRASAEDAALAALYLASPMSEFVTAESLDVDGGASAVGHSNVWNAERFALPREEGSGGL